MSCHSGEHLKELISCLEVTNHITKVSFISPRGPWLPRTLACLLTCRSLRIRATEGQGMKFILFSLPLTIHVWNKCKKLAAIDYKGE